MTYGQPLLGNHKWTLDEEQSRPFFKQALEAGINFFDTANVYSDGSSEEITGRALRDFAKRDEIVLATKSYFNWRKAPNTGGLSRKAIFTAVDDSLRRLGMDHIDLYQIHRWDTETPAEEILEALHDVRKSGKVRYLGASSMFAWQFARALYLAKLNGWSQFVSMQPHYNLIYREEEREMFGLCEAEGVGVLPWSPLARGRLARMGSADATARGREGGDEFANRLYDRTAESDRLVLLALERVAQARGVPRAQIALAWMRRRSVITAPIIGASKPHHIEDALASISLDLSDGEAALLEEAYAPHPVAGF
jgi:aryl-alcohol dehydrogenase-like predicted oxidoreductase